MIPPGIYLRDGKCNFQKNGSESIALRLCSSWWDAQVQKYRLKFCINGENFEITGSTSVFYHLISV